MEEPKPSGDIVQIETPEHVVFEYELAGPGSRVLAALIDFMLVGLVMLGLFIFVLVLVGGDLQGIGPYAVALGIVAAFVTLWGYPILFELYLRGQTPGKRSLGLRVIQEGGFALTPSIVLARNFMRIVDFLPAFYGLGLLVMVFNRRYKRLGDFVAGTLVIREKNVATASAPRTSLPRRTTAAGEEIVAALRRGGVHRLPKAQVQLIEDFLDRRDGMSPDARRRIALQLATAVRAVVETDHLMASERLLEGVAAAVQAGEPGPAGGAP
jgi:uncharacterized RDD family membrane protein YckC